MSWWNTFVDQFANGLIALADFTGNGGLAIIVLTVLVKSVLLPLTVKSVRSTAAMQQLQPQIKELQKQYGKDRQRLSQETMRLYAEYNINPVAGCLPLFFQMPIFFGLYFAIRRSTESGEGHFADSFLWISSLHEADTFDMMLFSVAPLAIVAGVFQFVQIRMMRPRNQGKVTDPQQAVMQMIMNFMPLMVVAFGWNFPAGVVLYWVTQSIYSVIQQWFIVGLGSVGNSIPWLPELPEHRRLGNFNPRRAVLVVSGESSRPDGVLGWIQHKIQAVETKKSQREQADTRRAGTDDAETSTESSFSTVRRQETVVLRVRGGNVERLNDASKDHCLE